MQTHQGTAAKVYGTSPKATKVITTTLYDMIAAINDSVRPEDEELVTSLVAALLNSSVVKMSPSAASELAEWQLGAETPWQVETAAQNMALVS